MPTIEQLVATASAENRIVRNFADHVAERTTKMRADLLGLSADLQQAHEDRAETIDTSGAALQSKVLKYLDQEISHLAAFDALRTQPGAKWLPFSVSTHKLSFMLPRVRGLFASSEGDSIVSSYAAGGFIHDESFDVKYPRLRTNTFFGSNAATMQAATMFSVLFATTAKTMADYALTDSSIAHAVPCENLPPSFVTSGSKFCITYAGIPAFAVPHGGYAFGGQRDQINQKKFGFEDCSSILANILYQSRDANAEYAVPAPMQTSTAHQLFAWRERQKDASLFIDRNAEMYDSKIAGYWSNILEDSNPTAERLQAGDLYLLRTFAKAKGDPDKHATGGGHTGVVIGRDLDDPSRALIFECARDMESEDPAKGIWGVAGAGIGSFNAQYNEELDERIKRNMFLRPQAKFR